MKNHPQLSDKDIISILETYLTGSRISRLKEAVAHRTDSIVTVLEKPYDNGNINAAMRSAEAFGFGDFHIIEGPKFQKPTGRTSAGAGKWLNIHRWKNANECLDELTNQNFQFVGTVVDGDTELETIDFSKKTAILFGSEHAGLSDQIVKRLDIKAKIPMVGLVESFNLSVAVALSLYSAHLGSKASFQPLNEDASSRLLADFYIRSVPNSKKILDRSI